MKRFFRTTVLTARAISAFVGPVLAESVTCVVTAPGIRLRKSPSKHAQVIAILKKDSVATAVGKCDGGWVKVTAKDGRLSGYVGGWALADMAPKTAAASAPVVAKAPATPVAAPVEVPTNEMLAVQITDLRMKVLGLDRDVDVMKKDIQKIKVAVARKSRHKHAVKKI